MSDVMQFKDLVSRSTTQSGLQSGNEAFQRKADPLADPLIQPLQRPAQFKVDAPAAKPDAAPAKEAAEAEPEAKPAGKAVQAKPESKPTVQAKAEPAAPAEEPQAESETRTIQEKVELGGGGGGGPEGDPVGDGGGDPIQAKGGGDPAIPAGPPGGGDAPEPEAPPAPTPGGDAASAGAAPAPAPAPAPSPAPAPPPAPAAPSAGGAPLPKGVQSKMEQSFGTDLSEVRVREDSSATQLGAQAYTQGKNITFAPGKYSPDTKSGQRLLGHEIGHTEQQAAGVVQADHQAKGGFEVNSDPGLEAEADRAGDAAADGRPATIASAGSGTQAKATTVQRKVVQLEGGLPYDPMQDAVQIAKVLGDYGPLRNILGSDKLFLEKVASIVGDWVASKKLEEVAAESVSTAIDKHPVFYKESADAWIAYVDAQRTPEKKGETTKEKAAKKYTTNPLYDVFQAVVKKHGLKGLAVESNLDHKEMHRAIGAWNFYSYNVSFAAKERIKINLWSTKKSEGKEAEVPPLRGEGADFKGDPGADTRWDKIVWAAWQKEKQENREISKSDIEASSSFQEHGWWSPDDRLKFEPTTKEPADETFTTICRVLSLAPEWYSPGFVTITVPAGKGRWVRPTAFDGMMSPLWEQAPANEVARAGGGAEELINQAAVEAKHVTGATAHIVSEGLNQELNDKANTNAWVTDPNKSSGQGEVGQIRQEVMADMGGGQETNAMKEWEPNPHRGAQSTYHEVPGYLRVLNGPDQPQPYVNTFIALDVWICGMNRKSVGVVDTSVPPPIPGVVERIADDIAAKAWGRFHTEIPALGFDKTASKTHLEKVSNDFRLMFNTMLFEEKTHIPRLHIYLAKEDDREAAREQRDAQVKTWDGKRDGKTDKYWIEAGKKPPSVSQEEWDKVLAEHKKAEGEQETQVVEQPVVPEEKPKEPKFPDATSIAFVTEKFEVTDKTIDKKNDIPLVVKGTVWMKKVEGEASDAVDPDGQKNVRRAVATSIPQLVENRVKDLESLDKATDPKEIEKICQVVAIMATYDAERAGQEILEVHAEVLRNENALAAFKEAQQAGEIDEKEDTEVKIGLEITEDEITGKIDIPILQMGGGVIGRNLSGSATYNRKGKVIKKFQGGGMIIIPIGASQVLEVKVEDVLFERKANGSYLIKNGKGTFTCRMPIHLFETKTGWKWYLAPGAKGSVTIEDNDISDITGTLELRVKDPEGVDFFRIKADTSFAIDKHGEVKKPLDGTVEAELLRDAELGKGFGPDKNWTAFLDKGTKATAVVSKGVLQAIDGDLKAHVSEGEKKWLTVAATGHYDHGKKTIDVPTARIEVIETTMVSRLGADRELLLEKGTVADAVVEKNEIKKISGNLSFVIKAGGKEKVGGKIVGSWEPDGAGLDGTAQVKLLDDWLTEPMSGIWIKLFKDSSGEAVMKKGELESLSGEVEADFTTVHNSQPVEVHFKGHAHYDWPKKKVVEAHAHADLKKPFALSERITLDTLKGDIWIAENKVTKAQGKLGAKFLNEKGTLFEGLVEGKWEAEGNKIDGTATVALKQDLDMEFGSSLSGRINQGANVTAIVANGQITTITGKLSAELLQDKKPIATLAAEGTYDVQRNVVVKLTANAKLLKTIKVLGDQFTIEDAKGDILIEENKLKSVTATATVTAPVIKVKKAKIDFTWRNDGAKDYYSFHGIVDWVFFEKKDRWLKGQLEVKYNEDGTFLATAAIDYQMSKGFNAKGKVSIDQTLEPTVLELNFGIQTTLADANPELFKLDVTLIKLFIPILGILQLRFGVDLGVQLGMKALKLIGKFGLTSPWKLDENTTVPDFEANLQLPWGLNLSVYLGAYLEAALSVLIASAGIGAEAGLRLNVPVDLTPSLTIFGSKEGFSGAFGLSLSIKPELLLEILAYVFADVIFMDPMEGELGKWVIPLASFEGINWSDEFTFGDQPEKAKGKAKKAPVKPPVPKGTPEKKAKPKAPKKADQLTAPEEKNEQKSNDVELGPGGKISGKKPMDDTKANTKDGGKEGQSKIEERMKNVQDVMEGLKSIDVFVAFIKRVGWAILRAGLMAPVLIAWEWLTGAFKWDELVDAYNKLTKGIKAVGKLLQDFASDKLSFTYRLGQWLEGKITIDQLIFGADDDAMKMYKQGLHKGENASYKVHGAMLNALCGTLNISQEEEEAAVVEIMLAAERKGHLAAAVNQVQTKVEYDGTDQILYHLDGDHDTNARKIFDRNGMPYGGTVTSGHSNLKGNIQSATIDALMKYADSGQPKSEGLKNVLQKQGLQPALDYAKRFGLKIA